MLSLPTCLPSGDILNSTLPMSTQSASNHTRLDPIFHRFVLPILMLHIVVTGVAAFREPTRGPLWSFVVAIAVALGITWGRVQALRAQDRLIRLEETLRMQRVLPADMHSSIARLKRTDFIALRFASDGELATLVPRVLAGEFAKPIDIKRAIQQWRPDDLRA